MLNQGYFFINLFIYSFIYLQKKNMALVKSIKRLQVL